MAGNGGGIDNCGTLTVTGGTIDNNGALYYGGGIDNSGMLTVTDSTIANNGASIGSDINGASNGGGIENSGTLTLTNSTIAGNSTNFEGEGGGIDNFGTLTATNTTIAYNFAAGLYDEAGGTATLYNTIVALNIYDLYDDIAGGPVSSASAYNLIGTGGSGGLANGSNSNLVGVASPGLAAALASNGGQIQTIALLAGSPAIGAGSATIPGVTVPTTDQRGDARPDRRDRHRRLREPSVWKSYGLHCEPHERYWRRLGHRRDHGLRRVICSGPSPRPTRISMPPVA